MNESESISAENTPRDSNTLRSPDLEDWRRIFLIALVAALIMGLSLNFFLIKQMGFLRKDLETVRPQLEQVLANYQKIEDPQIKGFINALVAYGRTHPDFNPILAKYKIAPDTHSGLAPMPTIAPITTLTPAPVSPKKK